LRLRRDQGLPPVAPLDPHVLAARLRVAMVTPRDLIALPSDIADRLLNEHHRSWSAVTVSMGSRSLIVYNDAHSRARQATDLTHELAHLLLAHKPALVFLNPVKDLLLRTFDQNQEEEASWLAGCILLPRQALITARAQRKAVSEIADEYHVSNDLVTYRLNVSGVTRQMSRRRA
jgi:Zn-dependent peptidase ImmA (M78 family)